MKRLTTMMSCLLAVTIDASAALIASGVRPVGSLSNWQLATVLHLVSVTIVGIAVARYRHRDNANAANAGTRTLALLAITLTLCAPVAGALVVTCLLAGFAGTAQPDKTTTNVVIGNPLRCSPTDPSTAPIVSSMNRNCLDELRQAGPLLHRNRSRHSITVLRQLQRHQDARTQLHAQGAIATLSESSEKQLTQLRRAEPGAENSRRLASLLYQVGVSGMRDEVTSKALIGEAIQHLEQSLVASQLDAENTTALQLLAECHLANNNTSPLPELIAQLRRQTEAALFADQIERRYHAALGHWHELATSVQGTSLNTTVAARSFWAGSPPVS